MPATPVLIYVQHLLGIGHLKRAAAIARALAARELEVVLVSGGMAEPIALDGVRLVQLEPVQAADARFSHLVDASGQAIDDEFKTRRRAHLLEVFYTLRPRAVITEMFPFGRRQLRFELMPLLEATHLVVPRPIIISSVRDILVEKGRADRTREMARLARDYYDRVLVHGDERLVPFGASFPLADELTDLIVHTGYVASGSDAIAPPGVGEGEIIISAGGGAVGARLIEAALGAHDMSNEQIRAMPWRVLVGAGIDEAVMAAWQARASEGMTVERVRADFLSLLGRAALSVSQASYNTVMDILSAEVRSVLVPFAAGQETEQSVRAMALAREGRAIVVPEIELNAERLIEAITRALGRPRPGSSPYRLDGAPETARLIAHMIRP
ncbi:MAG: glycosyltransferase [Alphaproteobacteria bacterium]|nr:glycosyltransferase [Alphaproteobacteria bacterium]